MEVRATSAAVSATTSLADPQQKYIESLRTTAETLNIARETAVALSQQSGTPTPFLSFLLKRQAEALDRAERNLDLTEATVKQANHVVRGMSWSGWLYNKFTKEPALHLPSSSSEISMGFICPECRVAQRSQLALMEHYDTMHAPTTSSQDTRQPSSRRDLVPSSHDRGTTASSSERHSHTDADGLSVDQRAFLDALAPQLLEIKQASRAIGNALDHHNAQLDRLDAKSDKAKDDMRLVTAKAINLTHSSMTIDVQFRCALQEQHSRRFMTTTSHGDPVFR
ncbi:hypothetical protein DYB26_002435 [Aphanomyces astaci]|uniref:t-SNARE coiled-coil homology domain-containing protein n=1 Tax=Aphanomyces astaci TaxID=112090 RepID=A0A418EMQ2_APHAT|nr:hypothetical protein DYB26_002435 [Aphanomyces astaci]